MYLNGIKTSSELTSNGYGANYTFFSLETNIISTKFYELIVSVTSKFGDVLIEQIECTLVYFDINDIIKYRYQMNSNKASLLNFGGKLEAEKKSVDLTPLLFN